jgi:hypothetical protein
MECAICEKRCEQTVKVFVKGNDKRQLCYACVVKLRTKRLEYSEDRRGIALKTTGEKTAF